MKAEPVGPEREEIRCPLCHAAPDEHRVVSTRDRDGSPLRSVLCSRCGLVFSNPMPTAAALSEFYKAEYRQSYKRATTPEPRRVLRAFRLAARRLEGLWPHIPHDGAALDLGAGGGEWVVALAKAGFDSRGVEPSVGFAEYALREYCVAIRVGTFDYMEFEPGSFRLITAFHVLEHLRDPGRALDRVRTLLAPDGRLVIEVPDIAATDQSRKSKFHFAHVLGFTPETLTALAKRHGFDLVADLSGRLVGSNVAIVLRKAEKADPGALPPPATAERVAAILATPRSVHRRTLPDLLRKTWRMAEERLSTRGRAAVAIGDGVLGPVIRRLTP